MKPLNQKGISIIEALVAVGIMSIVMAGFSSMIFNQQKEAKAISEKLAILDVERLLINSLSSGKICSAELAGTVFNVSGPYKINADNLAAEIISLNSLHTSNTISSPTLIAVNASITPGTSGLKIEAINFKNFSSAGIPDLFLTDLIVTLKDGVRALKPVVLKMLIETKPTDPLSAKSIINCSESGKSDRSYRFTFTATQSWVVPAGVTSAFVTMAGGGGSGAGWRITSAVFTGHSGGYVFSHPVNLIAGETINIIVGTGGAGFAPMSTGVYATPGPPHLIYTNPSGDDGLGGYPGTSTKIISPTLGTILECSGGSGHYVAGIDSYSTTSPVAGNLSSALTGSGSPAFSSPNRIATGSFVQANSPGACGPANYGKGNAGIIMYGISSGSYKGGQTPFGFGSGGDLWRSGCYITSTTVGTCNGTSAGKDGVVYIDVRY